MDYLMNYQDPTFITTTLLTHLLIAVPLWKMAKLTKQEADWFAWVPVLNGILALRIVKKPAWWILLFFVPVVNIVMAIVLLMALCERFSVNKWWGLLALISPANLILLYVLAFMDHGGPVEPTRPKVPDAKPIDIPTEPKEVPPSMTEDQNLSTPDLPENE